MTFKFCALRLTKKQFDWVIAKATEEGCIPSQVIGALIDQVSGKDKCKNSWYNSPNYFLHGIGALGFMVRGVFFQLPRVAEREGSELIIRYK